MTARSNDWLKMAACALAGALVVRGILRRRRRLELVGARVLVTGGSRGLGFAAARQFVRAGAHVAICARDQEELARARARLVDEAARFEGGEEPRVVALRADVTDERAVEELIEQVISELDGIDVLVNCAVEIAVGPVEAMTRKDFEQAFSGIFLALYQPTQAVLPYMRAAGRGRIVNVTSLAGKMPVPHASTYVVGKYATTGFSTVCAIELRKYGIRVSTVMPPPVRNGAWMNAAYKGQAEQELSWFAQVLGLPVASIDPERAARAIVSAARFGDAEVMVGPISLGLGWFHALLPELSVSLAALAERYLLPATPHGSRAVPAQPAAEILRQSSAPGVRRAVRMGKEFGERYLQPVAATLNGAGSDNGG
jgi:NAD(P)-dependent dehydrogenase (short-subunit alcohol dehydrogenase family)